MAESSISLIAPEAYLELGGIVIPPDPDIVTPVVRRAILDKRFEAPKAALVSGLVRPGDRVLEIGAGIGYVTALLARERRVSSVLAVEANPRLIDYMARLHARNRVRKVRRLNAVLTNAPTDHASFYLRRDFWAGSLSPGPLPHVGKVSVRARNLDALLRDEGVNLIVCDVAGSEPGMFEGADLTGVDRILVELHVDLIGLAGVRTVFGVMDSQGFVYEPRHSTGSVVVFQRLDPATTGRPA